MAFKQKAIGQGPTNDRNRKKNVFFDRCGYCGTRIESKFFTRNNKPCCPKCSKVNNKPYCPTCSKVNNKPCFLNVAR